MFDKKNGFDLVAFSILLSLSMAGLFIFGLIDMLFFNGGEGKTPTFLFLLQMFFGIIFSVILVVIVPIQILYFGRKNRDNTKLQKATIKDFIGLLFGVCDANVRTPKWISIPILALLWLLVAIFVLIFIMFIVTFCIAHS